MKRFTPVLLGLAVAASLAGCTGRRAPEAALPTLHLFHINDFHGHLEGFDREGEPVGGIARLARLVAEREAAVRARGGDSLVLVAGDVLQGTALSTAYRGEPDFRALNLMGVDAMTVGNHEFDFGLEVLQQRIAQARFPVLAANLRWSDGRRFTVGSVVHTTPRHGWKVGILGLVTNETARATHPRNVEGLVFEDPLETARRELPGLAAVSDVVVVLSHCGVAVDRRLAQLPGVDLVIGGHDQRVVEELDGPGAPILQAGEWGEYLGEAVIAEAGGRLAMAEHRLRRVTGDLPVDGELAAIVAGYRERLGDLMRREIGIATVRLEGERQAIRRGETNLGNLIADAVRESTGAELALINSGSIRASIDVGPITAEELYTVLPFDNRVVVVSLTGAEIQEMLDRSASLADAEDGAFLQVSGIVVRIFPGGHAALTVAGQPLEPEREYRVATTDFLAVGGDGYPEMKGKPVEDTGHLLNDLVLRWIERQARIEAVPDGRIVTEGPLREAA